MKTKLATLALSLLVVLGMSGCYTEFAATGSYNGGYGSSYNSADTSQYGYGAMYDSTGTYSTTPSYYGGAYGYGTYGFGSMWPSYG